MVWLGNSMASMETIKDLAKLTRRRKPIVLAAGFFDGVHVGHRKVIRQTIARARQIDGKAWILTFDTHPLKVLKPNMAPQLLTSNTHKLRLLRALGLDGCLLMPFTRKLADLDPDRFVRLLSNSIPSLAEVFIGKNWRFGKNAGGCPQLLSEMGRELGFDVTVVQPVLQKREPVSSSRIRKCVQAGDLVQAELLLDRPFSTLGTVTRGRAIARKLGFPTANLNPHNEVLPPLGVYAVRARLDTRRRTGPLVNGVINHGVRPTFDDIKPGRPVLEVHLFDMDRRLYGRDIEVFFVEQLRKERKFTSQKELRDQVFKDIERARAVLT